MTNAVPQPLLAVLELLPEPVVVLDAQGVTALHANGPYLARQGGTLDGLKGQSLATLLGGGAALENLAERLDRGETVSVRAQPGAAFAVFGTPVELRALRDADGVQSCWCFFRVPTPAAVRAPPAEAGVAGDVSGVHAQPLLREDRLTGLCHPDFFNDLYPRDFAIAAREGRPLAFFAIDIDELGSYNDTFGRTAGDSVIRRVGRALSSALRRAGDLVTREAGGRYVALAIGLDVEQARRHAETLAARVRELYIHHPHSKTARFVTVTVGVATVTPEPGQRAEILRGAATTALARAREQGRNRIGLLTLPLAP
jgi:diguanylate cyclase (GGDEF)-like protein